MQVLNRFVIFAAVSVTLGLADARQAESAQCPCTGNSPVINSFPYRSLRWGTPRVLQGTSECAVASKDDPRIAIESVELGQSPYLIRGFQLIVVDKSNKVRCAGTQLVGVIIQGIYKNSDEPIIIRQVAKAKVMPDSRDVSSSSCFLDEYRFAYMLAPAARPNNSLCLGEKLKNSAPRRLWRRMFKPKYDVTVAPQISTCVSAKACDVRGLSEVYPSQLAKYAIAIADADYDYNGDPESHNSGNPARVPFKDLEWFELACGGGALAHTDLSGLVEPGEPRDMRTAATRMLRANYRNGNFDTIGGVSIQFYRNADHTTRYNELCAQQQLSYSETNLSKDNSTSAKQHVAPSFGELEAIWGARGALCVSHARLWMKNDAVPAAWEMSQQALTVSESAFLNKLKVPRCSSKIWARTADNAKDCKSHLCNEIACTTSCKGKPASCRPLCEHEKELCEAACDMDVSWFTSGVVDHIDHLSNE